MDNKFLPQSLMPRTPAPDVFHTLNNQLQILLDSAEKLDDLTAHNQDARKHCSTIRKSAKKIAELIGQLSQTTNGYPVVAQKWPQLEDPSLRSG